MTNPADATASPFGWHDTNRAPGAEFTITQGNNAPYLDQDNNNAMDFGGSPTGEASRSTSGRPERARAELPQRRGLEPLLYEQRLPRHHVRLRVHRGLRPFRRTTTAAAAPRATTCARRLPTAAGPTTPTSRPRSRRRHGGTPRAVPLAGNQFEAQNQVVVNGLESFDSSWARFGSPAIAEHRDRSSTPRTAWPPTTSAPSGDWIAIVVGGNVGARTSSRPRGRLIAVAKAIVSHSTSAAAPVTTGSMTQLRHDPRREHHAGGRQRDQSCDRGRDPDQVRKHPSHPGSATATSRTGSSSTSTATGSRTG